MDNENNERKHSLYLTVSPSNGSVMLVLEHRLISFDDISDLEELVNDIQAEILGAKIFLKRSDNEIINESYSQEVIANWEKEVNCKFGLCDTYPTDESQHTHE